MLISAILDALFNIFELLTRLIDIPNLPNEVHGYIETALDYMGSGASLLANYVHLEYLLVLFGVILSVDIGICIYKFVMWVLKKIPVLNMK